MTALHAIILGIIQGITEFLPVSSSAHLIFASKVMGLTKQCYTFDMCLNFGSFLAIIVFFREDIWKLIRGLFNCSKEDRNFFSIWFISSVPAIVIFFIVDLFLDIQFKSPILLASTLISFGIILYLCDLRDENKSTISMKNGILIGLVQTLCIIPGVSRLGASMSISRYLNYSRSESFRFSMLLSIPLVSGALLITLLKVVRGKMIIEDWSLLFIGCLFSFLFGLLSLRVVTNFIEKHTLLAIVIYRVIFGISVLAFNT